ncbi:MAG TPA: hypothetical protein VKD70_01850 [Candidatus Acidoferrum sp.]|nr:hypothetical protein [Candidatus Acidoferrum sp.]
MNIKWLWVPLLCFDLFGSPASADNRIIVRTTLGFQGLQQVCNPLPVVHVCTVARGLGDPVHQLFLVTTPLNLTTFLNLLGNTVGIIDAEADQVVSLIGGLNNSRPRLRDFPIPHQITISIPMSGMATRFSPPRKL